MPDGTREAGSPAYQARAWERIARAVAAASIVAIAACGDEVDGATCEPLAENERKVLVDHDLWRLATVEEDPWRELRPADPSCDVTGRQAEDFAGQYSFGVDTALCSYTTVVQETLEDVCPGESILVWLWRFALTGPEGVNAHIAVQIGDELVFEDVVPIPNTSALKVESYPVAGFHPAGTPITFHVRNHGNNTYQLLEIARCLGACRPQ
jgi:hypothetical protein